MECKSEMWGTCEHRSLRLLNFSLDKLNAIQIQQLHACPSVWMMKRNQRLVRCCLRNTCYYINHCLRQWQMNGQFMSRLNPKCRTTDYHRYRHHIWGRRFRRLNTNSSLIKRTMKNCSGNDLKDTMSGIISLAKLTYSKEKNWATLKKNWKWEK